MPLTSPHEFRRRHSRFHWTFAALSSRGAWTRLDLRLGSLHPLPPWFGDISSVETEEIIFSCLARPSLAFLAPRSQRPLKAPGRRQPGWPRRQAVLRWKVPVRVTSRTLSCASCCPVSILLPPLRVLFLFAWFFLFFHFLAACHRNDTHSANSALDSFLQTRTTNSPVREQSERKMKSNIRKEPFGKLHKKCYIKIDTRAWPFVVLCILKPSIDSLLITCLF